jgi:multiple sugar transport system substrate-binding protein
MVEGELHGLGVGMSFPIIYVNADLARRAGYDPDDLPRDWDGILALARRIGDLGGTSQGGFFQYASGGNWTWIALVETLGGSMMTPDGRLGFTSREGLRSLEIIRAFGEVGQARYDVGQDPARTVFASGVLGVLVDSGSSLATFEKAAEGRFEVRTLPLPAASPRTRVPAAGIATVMHARDPRRQDLAWAFMTHASGPAGQTLVGRLTGYIPANQVPIEAAELLGDYYRQRPAYAAGIASAARVGPWFAFPGANTVKVSLDIRDHLRDVVTLKRTPAEGLAAIERSVRALVPGVRS